MLIATEPKVRTGRAGWPQKGLEARNKPAQVAAWEGAGAAAHHIRRPGGPRQWGSPSPRPCPAPAPGLQAPQTAPQHLPQHTRPPEPVTPLNYTSAVFALDSCHPVIYPYTGFNCALIFPTRHSSARICNSSTLGHFVYSPTKNS